MPKNVLVAQSGGPSAVINNSIRGVMDACRDAPAVFGHIYGAWHGIEGVLNEALLDLSAQAEREIRLLEHTPAAGAIGTCRYKLKEQQAEDFQRVVDVLKAHNIGFFFYAGGNDSMDTANKIAQLAARQGLDLVATGVPKTIDNDVGDAEFKLVDHTPGYGSTARYWAFNLLSANEENAGSCPADPVLVLQAMGRKIGFIPAAARLADPERRLPIQIYLTESGATLEQIAENVNAELKRSKRCIVVVSEGFDVGDIGAQKDSFGHTSFGASERTAQSVIVSYLNKVGLAATGKARGQAPGTDQRHSSVLASGVDLQEAYESGRYAVEIARQFGGGYMATILRAPGATYRAIYDKVPLDVVANSERFFPKPWIAANGYDVTDAFVRYAMPLIGTEMPHVALENGLPRYTRFQPIFAAKKCSTYVPQAYR
ncbi:MAG: diphosphate--fructose-6-phosphate 1-phosphotransferase [Kiritimatiellia bacterium]